MTEPNETRPLRVLVVDDSAYNRQTITSMLESREGVEVIARATNGKEALKLAFDLEPDIITLDLEMPEMDGFSFLRLLMSRRPIPVLVISGYAQRDNVFRALELGALDFIAKPRRHISPDIRNIEDELSNKIAMVRRLHAVRLKQRAESLAAQGARPKGSSGSEGEDEVSLSGEPASVVVGIGSSTGGPPAIQQLLASLPADLPAAILISQHMPARFTKAFAARLDRVVDLHVVEAAEGQPVCQGVVYIVPGSSNLEVESSKGGGSVIHIVEPQPTRAGALPLTPSADHMLKSLSSTYGRRLVAVILTGMGSDGTNGTIAARRQGATVLVEDPSTAVMPGMPHSAMEAGTVDRAVPLEKLGEAIVEAVERHKRN
ncbi:chemotaxis-specific protein-glutamate methyltransferase CheB [Pseudenhygromyxa sp. WMMC2535]|uniref:chemotaxis-specific protein-glutamate methyltransferase CheB n=1 Tax=Pseudenhygromyxa sp. WMMC2535 TaxID=2712867 RepID=UPI0015565FB2|nr:chemotaxis-specific protein-glutamate methyltransferase CheB [Pseudenhygromyxa sp. WMMC2535]NVB42175.1 chemotaxis-specific protein-glutamate methyltransferase CheB [Pseudenhygromyxa sp. WMMC2535]